MPGEGAHVTYLVRVSSVTIGAIVASHTLLETARDTLFLERIPVAQLPWMYLGVAALSLVLAFAPPLRGDSRGAALPLLLLGGSVGTFFFWARASSPTHTLYYALYIWTALCGMTVVTQFWTTMARIFTLGEAKRLFATIAIGSVAGSVLGAGLARVFFLFTGARALVLLASAGFAASAVLAVLLRPSSPSRGAAQGRAAKELREELATTSLVGKNPYLLTIGSLALAMAITATVVDYSFKRALVRHFAPEEIGPIVSSVTFASYALGGIVQIFFVARILAAVGTARSLRLLPAVLAVGAVAGVAMPYTFVAIGLRTIDGAFRYTLQRTATELLYVPVSEAIRGRVKTLIDVVTQRAGQAIASLALLAVPAAMHTRYLVLAVAVCSTVWFWLAVRVRPRYLALFRAMIQEGVPQVFDAMPALDQSGVEALVAALSDERDEQVLFALDVLASRGKAKLIPTLILFHPSSRVVLRALAIFASSERRDAARLAWRLLSHHDPAVRAQAVHTVSALDFDVDRVRALASSEDGDAIVADTALVELWARGLERDVDIARVTQLLSPSGDPAAQRVLLRALSTTRSRRLLLAALPLAEHAPFDVQIEIANAVEADPIPEAVGALLLMLAHWPTRDPARKALVAVGEPALAELVRLVHDLNAPPFLRTHAPRSISRFAPDLAVPLLLEILLRHPEGIVRFKALRGLGRLAADGAVVRLDDAKLLSIVERDIVWSSRALGWSERLAQSEDTPAPGAQRARALLQDLIREKGANAGERLFRIIALRYRGEDWERIFDGFRDGRWDAGRELVEGVLREPLRGRLLAMIDRVAAQSRTPLPTKHDAPLAPLLTELMTGEDHMLAAVAAYYAKAMRLPLPTTYAAETPGGLSSPP